MNIIIKRSAIFIFIALSVWITAGIVTSISKHVLYTPPQPQKKMNPALVSRAKPKGTKENYAIIAQRNLFKAQRPDSSKSEQDISNAPFSKLKLVLKGTVTGPEEFARAIIEEDKQQKIYRIGDSVHGAVIQAVFRNEIVLSVNGRAEKLAMLYDMPGREDPNQKLASYPEPMKEIMKEVPNAKVNPEVPPASFPALVISSSPVAPSIAQTQTMTNIVRSVRDTCLGVDTDMSQYGIQAGDVIKSINGVPVRYQGVSMRPAKSLPTGDTDVRFELERNHSIISVNIPVSSYSYWKGG